MAENVVISSNTLDAFGTEVSTQNQSTSFGALTSRVGRYNFVYSRANEFIEESRDSYTQASFPAFDFLFDYLRSFAIEVENPEKVAAFLLKHQTISRDLYCLSELLADFRATSNFCIRVVAFNDTEEVSENLAVAITTSETPANITEKLRILERSWYSQMDPSSTPYCFVSVDFKP